ncbi:MAG: putative baseplate assembly protein [Myxococcota bacterium]|nr:putative baseplate assembly protein [Myxococcota bacterium]
MSLRAPDLDERDFDGLVAEALRFIRSRTSEWTDLTPHDPGVVLLEVFAHLTDQLIHRFNEIPENAYVAFLELMGVKRTPPSAARALLTFSLAREASRPVEIPEGTRVTATRGPTGEAPTFVTSETRTIDVGATRVDVVAHHCDLVSEELGISSGLPGQSYRVRTPPIVARLPERIDLVVGIAAEGPVEGPAREFEGASFEIWNEVEDFSSTGPEDRAYVVDRVDGRITFGPSIQRVDDEQQLAPAPEAIAAIPPEGRRILAWYRAGGGNAGNVAAGTLTELRSQVAAGLKVSNALPATGGRDAESVANAIARGPLEIHSLRRALTARDYEMWAVRESGAVNRALAITQATRWRHAEPGTVELVLVPALPPDAAAESVGLGALEERARGSEGERDAILRSLDERKPLGTRCEVRWAHYKRISVHARVVAHRAENTVDLRRRVQRRLERTINPLDRGPDDPGWPFGVAVRSSHIYGILLAEPGVLWVEPVRLEVDQVPDRRVAAVVRDHNQPQTWYASGEAGVFRSENGGDGWEQLLDAEAGARASLHVHPELPGHLAVLVPQTEGAGTTILVSTSCGESFALRWSPQWRIHDAAWLRRDDGTAYLFLAGEEGLHGLAVRADATLEPIAVAPTGAALRLRAVAAARDRQGRINVAVAAEGRGVFLSIQGGRRNTFRPLEGLETSDVHVLEIARVGVHDQLWAGIREFSESGWKGCRSWRLVGADNPPDGWVALDRGWDEAGSCTGLAFGESTVFAATAKGGVLRLALQGEDASWEHPRIDAGFFPADEGRFVGIDAIGFDPERGEHGLLLAGDAMGVLRSTDGGQLYWRCSERSFDDRVTLPTGWLPCSGEHDIEVVHERETERD